MSEYGSGISFSRACMYNKERIKKAFSGEVMVGKMRTVLNMGRPQKRSA